VRGGSCEELRAAWAASTWATTLPGPSAWILSLTAPCLVLTLLDTGCRSGEAMGLMAGGRHQNRSIPLVPGRSMEETYLLAMRCPVYRRRDSHPGFRTELENLVGNDKGEGPSGSPARPTVPMCRTGADCSVVAMRRGNSRGAKGGGSPSRDRHGSTGNRRNPMISAEGAGLPRVARAV
jgi:hypothetical protein